MAKENLNWLNNKVLNSASSRPTTTSMTAGASADLSQRNSTARGSTMDTGGLTEQGPPPATDWNYIPGYLKRHIGKNVRAEFLLGTAITIDKTGILREVGVNYFVLEDYISHALVMCDLYSVRFVTTL